MVTITGRALLERIVGKDHAREITRRDGVFDNSQTTTFKPEYALRDLLQNGLPGDCDGKTLDILVDPKERTAVIRDDGTGFTYYRLARCSSTKIGSTTAAGLFGRGGTKEAPMTLALDGAGVIFRTQDWAALGVAIPNPAEGVIMLDYDYVGNLPKIKGTEIHLVGLSDAMIRYLQRPEDNFVYFKRKKDSTWKPTYTSPKWDSVLYLDRKEVFIRGVRVNTWDELLFSYDFVTVRAPIDRERTRFDEREVRRAIGTIYDACTAPDVIQAILTHGAADTAHTKLEYSGIHGASSGATKDFWKEQFYQVFGDNAIIEDVYSSKNKERLKRVAVAQKKRIVRLEQGLSNRLHTECKIPFDSDLTINYEDLMWTTGELEKVSNGVHRQVDIPLHTAPTTANFDPLFAALSSQHLQRPHAPVYDFSYMMVSPKDNTTHVVPRTNLAQFLVNSGVFTGVRDVALFQRNLDQLYEGAPTKSVAFNISGYTTDQVMEKIIDHMPVARIPIPIEKRALDIREIGLVRSVAGSREEVYAQAQIADLAEYSLDKEDVLIVKGQTWIATPAKRETDLGSGDKVKRTIFDCQMDFPAEEEQYLGITSTSLKRELLTLGARVLGARREKPKVFSRVSSETPETSRAAIASPLRASTGAASSSTASLGEILADTTSIFLQGFLYRGSCEQTIFGYNFSTNQPNSTGGFWLGYYVPDMIRLNKDKRVIRKVLEVSREYGTAMATEPQRERRNLPLELLPQEGAYTFDAETKKIWAQTFTETFGRNAVIRTAAVVEEGNWLQYYADESRGYGALADRFGFRSIHLTEAIAKTLIEAGVLTDKKAFEADITYNTLKATDGKRKAAYDLGTKALTLVEKSVTGTGKKHTYELHFFTTATLITGATADKLTYAVQLEGKEQGLEEVLTAIKGGAKTAAATPKHDQITHKVYVNITEVDTIKDEKTARAYLSNVVKIALDDGTARDFAATTIGSALDLEIRKVGGEYRTSWERFLGTIGIGGRK